MSNTNFQEPKKSKSLLQPKPNPLQPMDRLWIMAPALHAEVTSRLNAYLLIQFNDELKKLFEQWDTVQNVSQHMLLEIIQQVFIKYLYVAYPILMQSSYTTFLTPSIGMPPPGFGLPTQPYFFPNGSQKTGEAPCVHESASDITTMSPFISDHALQIAQIHFDDKKITPIKIGTFNILDKMKIISLPKESTPIYNNPFNKIESSEEFTERVKHIRSYILSELQIKALDILFLQEIVAFTADDKYPLFVQELEKLNYTIILTKKVHNQPYSQKALAIIYKNTKLTPFSFRTDKMKYDCQFYRSSLMQSSISKSQKPLCIGMTMCLKIVNQPYVLIATNVHGLYSKDDSYLENLIQQWKEENLAFNIFEESMRSLHLIAGDFNVNLKGKSGFVSSEKATNFICDGTSLTIARDKTLLTLDGFYFEKSKWANLALLLKETNFFEVVNGKIVLNVDGKQRHFALYSKKEDSEKVDISKFLGNAKN
jgi:hypothetical protein